MSDHVSLTTVSVRALAQPLVDFLSAQGVLAHTFEDETGLDATRTVDVRVAAADEQKARELLAVFWAENEGARDEM